MVTFLTGTGDITMGSSKTLGCNTIQRVGNTNVKLNMNAGTGTVPSIQFLSSAGWVMGFSDVTTPYKHLTMGWLAGLNNGVLYSFDQNGGVPLGIQFSYPGFPATHTFNGPISCTSTIAGTGISGTTGTFSSTVQGTTLTSTSSSLNGITIPSSGGTLAKTSDILNNFTPAYINLYYDAYPANLFLSNTVITIGTTTSDASGCSVSSNNIFLPSVAGAKYLVSVSIPVYKYSQIYLADGNNAAIAGTTISGGHPTLDAMTVVLAGSFVISQPALDKFSLRAGPTQTAYVGDDSSSVGTTSLHISVVRIV